MRLTESRLRKLVMETVREEQNKSLHQSIMETVQTVLEADEEEVEEGCEDTLEEADESDEVEEGEEVEECSSTMTEGFDLGRWKNLAGIL